MKLDTTAAIETVRAAGWKDDVMMVDWSVHFHLSNSAAVVTAMIMTSRTMHRHLVSV